LDAGLRLHPVQPVDEAVTGVAVIAPDHGHELDVRRIVRWHACPPVVGPGGLDRGNFKVITGEPLQGWDETLLKHLELEPDAGTGADRRRGLWVQPPADLSKPHGKLLRAWQRIARPCSSAVAPCRPGSRWHSGHG